MWRSESFDTSSGNFEGVGQGVDGPAGVVAGDGGQMGVPGGGQDADMTQDLLEFDQIYAEFQHMGGIIVAQRVA